MPSKPLPFPEEQVPALLDMVERWVPLKEIGAYFGMSAYRVESIARRYGAVLPEKGKVGRPRKIRIF